MLYETPVIYPSLGDFISWKEIDFSSFIFATSIDHLFDYVIKRGMVTGIDKTLETISLLNIEEGYERTIYRTQVLPFQLE